MKKGVSVGSGFDGSYDALVKRLNIACERLSKNGDLDRLAAEIYSTEGVLKFLWKIGIPKTLTKALEGMMNDLCNRAELVKRGNRSGRLRALSQRITMACAAATITFMKEDQRQKVEIATRKVARVIGVEWTRLRQFRNHIHRGLADNITRSTYQEHLADLKTKRLSEGEMLRQLRAFVTSPPL